MGEKMPFTHTSFLEYMSLLTGDNLLQLPLGQ